MPKKSKSKAEKGGAAAAAATSATSSAAAPPKKSGSGGKKGKSKAARGEPAATSADGDAQRHHHHHHRRHHHQQAEEGGGGGSGSGGTATLSLSNGAALPVVGLGTWQAPKGQVGEAVRYAVEELGYRHLDCASNYLNEDEIGDTITDLMKRKVIKRSDLFITGKLNNPYHHKEHVIPHVKKSLLDLNVSYIDLLLMHWPVAFHYVPYDETKRGYDASYQPDSLENIDLTPFNGSKIDTTVSIQETWQAMEELVDLGLVKAIGVANFTTALLHDLLSYARIKPAVNQVELHPYCQQSALVHYCKQEGIVVEAYSPLGSPGSNCGTVAPAVLNDSTLRQIAAAHGKSVAQVCLRWGVQRGTVVLPKSTNAKRLAENLSAGSNDGFKLSDVDMAKIAKIDRNVHYLDPFNWYGIPLFGENGVRGARGCRMILLGPPGSGKATQAPFLADYYQVPYLSTARLLREKRPDLSAVMDRGELVSDDTVADLVSDAINGVDAVNGFILDGYPKTVAQAQQLSKLLAQRGESLDAVVQFSVDDNAVLVHRVMGRWVHMKSGRVYHTESAPPIVSGIDDVTGEALERHADDSEEALLKRLDTYFSRTEPLLAYYKKLQVAVKVNAAQHPLVVFKEIKDGVQNLSLDRVINEFEHVGGGSGTGGDGGGGGGGGDDGDAGGGDGDALDSPAPLTAQAYADRSAALSERERQLNEREAKLVQRERDIEALEAQVQQQEEEVAQREARSDGGGGGGGSGGGGSAQKKAKAVEAAADAPVKGKKKRKPKK